MCRIHIDFGGGDYLEDVYAWREYCDWRGRNKGGKERIGNTEDTWKGEKVRERHLEKET